MNGKPVIAIRDLNHFYGNGSLRRQVLFDINVEIFPGEIVIVTGPSGSGKTTLLTLIGALRSAQDGSVRVLGHELRDASHETRLQLRRRLGFVFQSHNLLESLTACQNVQTALAIDAALTPPQSQARACEWLEAVGLAHKTHSHPRGLSGGEKQRVAIARALAARPEIILADEPTASLDKKTGHDIVDLLHNLARQQHCAILLVTHDHRILDVADRVISLEDGRLSSFSRGVMENTARLLTTLSRLNRQGELRRHIQNLDDQQFIRVLEQTSSEFEQLVQVIELGNREMVESMLDQLLEAFTIRISELLDADRATLFLVDENRKALRSKVAQHTGEKPLEIIVPLNTGIAGRVAATGQGMNIADAYASPDFNRDVDRRTGYRTRSILCLPMMDRRRSVFAVAQILNKRDGTPFNNADERKFREFATAIAPVLESCRRLQNLTEPSADSERLQGA